MPKEALTTGEVAGYCGVNFRTVIRWIERGLLEAYKLPGRGDNRIRVEDFLTFLRENEMPIPDDFRGTSNRVLIVEDEPAMASAIQRVLRRRGFDTTIASDGFSAGALVAMVDPVLVTLDLMIPGIKGVEVLRFIRSTPRLAHVKILVVSGMPRKELDEALAAGADDALAKPFDNRTLLAKIDALLGPRGAVGDGARGAAAPR